MAAAEIEHGDFDADRLFQVELPHCLHKRRMSPLSGKYEFVDIDLEEKTIGVAEPRDAVAVGELLDRRPMVIKPIAPQVWPVHVGEGNVADQSIGDVGLEEFFGRRLEAVVIDEEMLHAHHAMELDPLDQIVVFPAADHNACQEHRLPRRCECSFQLRVQRASAHANAMPARQRSDAPQNAVSYVGAAIGDAEIQHVNGSML